MTYQPHSRYHLLPGLANSAYSQRRRHPADPSPESDTSSKELERWPAVLDSDRYKPER